METTDKESNESEVKQLEEGEDENDDEDQTWVVDSLIGFLKSPLWSSSLNNFVDQMSVVFEPDDIEDEHGSVQHRAEYESIFKQYRSLVDRLICTHMSELGITEEQFATACEMAEGLLATKLKSILFEELWAAEDYEVFIRLMARRNVELQLEALDILAQRYGLVYDVFVPVGASAKHFLSEEHVMREAILRSLDDLELEKSAEDNIEIDNSEKHLLRNKNKQIKKKVKTNETIEEEVVSTNDDEKNNDTNLLEDNDESANFKQDKARLEEIRQRVDQKMYEALHSAMAKDVTGNVEQEKEDEIGDENEIKDKTGVTAPTDLQQQLEELETPSAIEDNTREITQEENKQSTALREEQIRKRAEYLREQRDRIIQMKQKVRSDKISKYLIKEKEKAKTRPKTARRPTTGDAESGKTTEETDSKELAYRKTLAARLKSEVIFGED